MLLLSEAERRTLKSSPVAPHLIAYQNLQRLETDFCPIAQERPEEREDTYLLVKQYLDDTSLQRQQRWLPVPGQAHIFELGYLKGQLLTDAKHPINRDYIPLPPSHNIDGVEYQTRYIMHPYYLNDAGPGVSQELIQLSTILREHLSAVGPSPMDSDNDYSSVHSTIYY